MAYAEHSTAHLVHLALTGDEEGFMTLVTRYKAIVASAAYSVIPNVGEVEEITVTEVDAETAGRVLKAYVEAVSVVRSYFDASKDDTVSAFVAEADRHPVFRINV